MRSAVMVMSMAWATSVAAQTPVAPPPVDEPSRSVGEQVFIAPSGEPFRAPRGAPYPIATWFAQADRNHDGRLSESEMVADFKRFFDLLDADHDGLLRPEEIARYENVVAPEVQSYGNGGGRHFYEPTSSGDGSSDVGKSSEIESDLKTDRPTGGGRFGLINIPEPVKSMDIDFSGSVTEQEMRGAAHRRFVLLDGAGKGSLAMSDLPTSWAQAHPRKR